MLTIFLTVAVAFFFGLGIIGGLFIKGLLLVRQEQGKLSGLVMTILSWLLVCLTLSGIYALVSIYAEYKADVTEEMKTVFAIILFVMIGLLFAVAKEWNQLLQKLK
ncbi:MAG: hypothetical protein ABI167_11230 [Nitrosospira sp.]